MKVRLIADGSTRWQRLIKRWGLSFLVGEDVLFDTFGDARVFLRNVRKHSIDLSAVRHVVISHDDWDHIAGLWDVLDRHKGLKVYVVPHFQAALKDRIRSYGVTLVEAPGPAMIRDGVYTTGELQGRAARGVLYEQALAIRDGARLGVVTGCAHPRLPDILQAVKDRFHQKINTVAGGFHLKDMEQGRIRDVVEGLSKFGVSRVAPLHCTGPAAVKEFRRFFVDNCFCLREGEAIEV